VHRFLTPSQVLALNRKMREAREKAIREQGPVTPELAYSQVQRHHGYWPHKRDMTTEEMEAHSKMMEPIWDKISAMTKEQRAKRYLSGSGPWTLAELE
jgi:hypothetical protein